MTDDEREPTSATPRRHTAGLVAAVALGIALLAFIVQNSGGVEVQWLMFDGEQPLWLLLVITALIGAMLARLVPFIVRRVRGDDDE